MILDAYGQPIRKPVGFITPKWLADSMTKLVKAEADAISNMAIESKVDDLYASAEVERSTRLITGSTVNIRLPERWSNAR